MAFSNHKQEYGGPLKEFFQENSKRSENWLVLWPEMGENGRQNPLLSRSLQLHDPPILQSGELQIKQNLMSKIKPAKLTSLVPRPSSTLTFGGPGMPNQMFEWVGPRQRFCTQCHYDNFLGTPTATYSLLEKSGAAAIIGEWLSGSVSC